MIKIIDSCKPNRHVLVYELCDQPAQPASMDTFDPFPPLGFRRIRTVRAPVADLNMVGSQ